MSRELPTLLLLLPALLAGCTRSLAGDWYGICAFGDQSYEYGGALAITIENGGGQRINGTVKLDMAVDDQRYQGKMTGIRSDTFVEMEAPLTGADGQSRIFHLEGDIEDDGSIDGTCRFSDPEAPGGAGLVGDVVLEQP